MAPSQKRKTIDSDFILTISDNEDDIPNEEEFVETAPPKKKAKTSVKKGSKNKKGKKQAPTNDDEDAEDETLGVWGQNDEDDGAMDSDFEFALDNGNAFEAEFDNSWGFEGAMKGIKGTENKVNVDLDAIIKRRRDKKEGKTPKVEKVEEEAEDEEEDEEEVEVDLDDSDDEILADDAFGMGVGSDVDEEEDDKTMKDAADDSEDDEEEQDDEKNDDDDEDAAASDNDSVATPVEHPADQDSGSEDEEDAEEAARRKEFFADEDETAATTKKGERSSFQGMSLSRPILRGLTSVGFTKPTPIQAKTIPIALMGKDVVGGAVTGSGKTAAFVVPILERLLYRPKKVPTTRVVILTPTRELAIQCHSVATKLACHTDIKFCLAVGGLSLKVQEGELRLRPDVVIATPGRFIDHMRNSASFAVDTIEILVLDEADRMLEDGFADELNEILTTMPKSRQTMLFSATMTSSVDRLIRAGLNKPARIMVDSQKKTATNLVQEFVRLRPGREKKRIGYLVHICKKLYTDRVIIFFRQKKIVHETRIIFGLLGMSCAELHGSMNQAQRIASVEAFRDGKVSFLLATDLASRGLDIKGVDTVINFEAPQTQEIYVHRVGRTARAGRSGVAITLAAEPDRKVVKQCVRAGKANGAKISSRIIDPSVADEWQAKVDEMADEIKEIIQEEKEEKQLQQVEMQVKKGENMIKYEDEIAARPKRTWFESEQDKKAAKLAGRAELNGVRDKMKKKNEGKLSNKDKKKLDSKAERTDGRSWKKGRAERDGKGAVLNLFRRIFKSLPKLSSYLRPARPQQSSLLRYIFPFPAIRQRYRERLLNFRLLTVPYYKHRAQGRIHRFLVERDRKRRKGTRLVDIVRRQLLLGREKSAAASLQPKRLSPSRVDEGGEIAGIKNEKRGGSTVDINNRPLTPPDIQPQKMASYRYNSYNLNNSSGGSGYGSGGEATQQQREAGARRKRLAAIAGSVYRAGAAAASELKEQYNNTRIRNVEAMDASQYSIPGAFPNVKIITKGEEQMVLFPTYAKRHVKGAGMHPPGHVVHMTAPPQTRDGQPAAQSEEDYWKSEWNRAEDEKAVVDVDIRGWIYMPSKGPMTRRNRVLIGIARRLSGIPPPTTTGSSGSTQQIEVGDSHEERERMREEERIAKEAREIEKQGMKEEEVAERGGYSEAPGQEGIRRTGTGSSTPPSPPLPPSRTNTGSTGGMPTGLTDAELAVANANLMARIGPFMTTPLVQLPITIFFYNDQQSRSHTINTDDSGHFITRVFLDFVPTHVRVLANENISATNPIEIIEPVGVSLISDVDDTIKRSNIGMGAREIFRNTFIRDLSDLTVPGVTEWYHTMYDMGVKLHYCSNSPWQLFPVLATFFHGAGLPHGSIHLKHYSGMLQGIFEPVAERKKGTLEAILRDFPERKFILVGDSGEADLEVYTELAVQNPGRILGVFIRDVTTPEELGFFDPSYSIDTNQQRSRQGDATKGPVTADRRPPLPPRVSPVSSVASSPGPTMGTLIDFSDDNTDYVSPSSQSRRRESDLERPKTATTPSSSKGPPPPRPAKPAALRSSGSSGSAPTNPRVHALSVSSGSSPQQSSGGSSVSSSSNNEQRSKTPPAPPPPRRRGTGTPPSQSPSQGGVKRIGTEFSDILPPSALSSGSITPPHISGNGNTAGNSAAVVNKKVDLWLRRLARAHETLDELHVPLYTWRRGEDVIKEAEGIVREALKGQNHARPESGRSQSHSVVSTGSGVGGR
ncbi:hypothetical protein QBC35DRAFT_514594 [Podospora australis]|uniref:ATP-dependent RNA helicase n=1 Tax=Podospora australis TaxID=1536484 RepID=A0AAN6WUL0_9PEZI|nr:hypothetical protein QBC35DRAFT_514594 [Podospora australis]